MGEIVRSPERVRVAKEKEKVMGIPFKMSRRYQFARGGCRGRFVKLVNLRQLSLLI